MASCRARAQQPERINLVFISTGLSIGGAETMLYRLATEIDALRFCVRVVSLTQEGQIGARLKASGIPVVALNLQPGRVPWFGMSRLTGVLETLEPDLLQGWMYHGNLAAQLARARLPSRPPVIWAVRQSLYGLSEERSLTRAVIWTCARLSRRPAAILYNSHVSRAQHEAAGFAPTRSRVIPNGFALPPQARAKDVARAVFGLPADRTLVGLLARYHPIKDHATFLRAAAQVVTRHPQVHFVLAGRAVDPRNRELVRLVTSLGLTDRVRLLGEIDDASELVSALDVLCSTSQGEAFPNVVAEAMAAAVPVVVTDIGDSAEIVGTAGHVIAPGDAEALALAVAQLLTRGSAARAALGAAARGRIAERYRLQDVVRRYEEVYQEVCGRVRHRRAV